MIDMLNIANLAPTKSLAKKRYGFFGTANGSG